MSFILFCFCLFGNIGKEIPADDTTLSVWKVVDGSVMHLVIRKAPPPSVTTETYPQQQQQHHQNVQQQRQFQEDYARAQHMQHQVIMVVSILSSVLIYQILFEINTNSHK